MTSEEMIRRIEDNEKIHLLDHQRSLVKAILDLPEFATFPRVCGSGKSFMFRFIEKCLTDLQLNPDLLFNNLKHTPLSNPFLIERS